MTIQGTRAPIFTNSPSEDGVNVCLRFLSAKTSSLGAKLLVGLLYPSDTKIIDGRKRDRIASCQINVLTNIPHSTSIRCLAQLSMITTLWGPGYGFNFGAYNINQL